MAKNSLMHRPRLVGRQGVDGADPGRDQGAGDLGRRERDLGYRAGDHADQREDLAGVAPTFVVCCLSGEVADLHDLPASLLVQGPSPLEEVGSQARQPVLLCDQRRHRRDVVAPERAHGVAGVVLPTEPDVEVVERQVRLRCVRRLHPALRVGERLKVRADVPGRGPDVPGVLEEGTLVRQEVPLLEGFFDSVDPGLVAHAPDVLILRDGLSEGGVGGSLTRLGASPRRVVVVGGWLEGDIDAETLLGTALDGRAGMVGAEGLRDQRVRQLVLHGPEAPGCVVLPATHRRPRRIEEPAGSTMSALARCAWSVMGRLSSCCPLGRLDPSVHDRLTKC